MKIKSTLLLTLAGGQMCLLTAGAQTVSEDFNSYANGTTIGSGTMNGGGGWYSAWQGNGQGGAVNNGVLSENGASGGAPAYWRYFNSLGAINSSTTYYFRADLGANSPTSQNEFWGAALTDNSGNRIGELIVEHTWVTSQIGSTTFTGNTAGYTPNGGLEEMLGELQWNNNSLTLSVWATPASSPLPGSQAAAGAPTWVQTGAAPTANNLGGVLLEGFSVQSDTTVEADNLLFGPTWASVTTVPEPSILGLLGLGGLFLSRRFRK